MRQRCEMEFVFVDRPLQRVVVVDLVNAVGGVSERKRALELIKFNYKVLLGRFHVCEAESRTTNYRGVKRFLPNCQWPQISLGFGR